MFIPLRDDNPTTIQPMVTIGIVALCVVVFLWQLTLDEDSLERFVYAFGMIPVVLFDEADLPPEVAVVSGTVSLFTSMSLHGGFMHIAGNMLYLWIFGNNVEDAMGHARFIAFYLICGVAAALAHAFADPGSEIPTIGASGAIAGVLGAYLVLHPRANIQVLLFLGVFSRMLNLPAVAVLGFWLLLQIVNAALGGAGGGGVAWFAHIGGFIAGMVLIPFFKHGHVRLLDEGRGGRGPWRRGPWG
ncbi:MAG: rhomboid family intramembrane serine protease [Rhodospirillaceae bacterium]|nr:rhomboid family intramembrane serine protease [Rhodospirillaceae bacterium]